ncbi:MAG: bifunctional glutamate N-acetyltransferase/amino-acid acetyltransferase ArgJ [Anaerolineae bacterium]
MNNAPTAAIARVAGFRAAGVTCGLKKSGRPDLALILADSPCSAAALFTTNAVKAAPVLYDMQLLQRTRGLRAVLINAGNANAVTGAQGMVDAARMAALTETACQLPADSVFVMSTGIIGEKMPMDRVKRGISAAAQAINSAAGEIGQYAAEAIMTTDTVPKQAYAETTLGGATVRVGGMAKGSGMIHVNMATMLAVVVTDAAIEPALLDTALRQVAAVTFNRVTVDGDTSTNDTLLLLASGQAKNSPIVAGSAGYNAFVAALTDVCTQLSKAIARDGEGATKLVEITVTGAATEAEADRAAKTVATSPLVKTAIFGADPNWGRILMAVGRSGVTLSPEKISLWLGDALLVRQGEPQPFDAAAVSAWLSAADEVPVRVSLGLGSGEATVWTCDFSYKYVEINAEYHT